MWIKITNFHVVQGTFSPARLVMTLGKAVYFPNTAEPFLKITELTDGDIEKLYEEHGIKAERYSPPPQPSLLDQIPGHMKAYTWIQTLAVMATAYAMTGRIGSSIVGAIIFSLGEFYGNQATHLAQPNHSHDLASLTGLERVLGNHPAHFRRLGLVIMVIGLVIAFRT